MSAPRDTTVSRVPPLLRFIELSPLVVAASLASLGCKDSEACTQKGCQSGLVIELAPSGGWRPGTYRFEIESDSVPTTCEGKLPLQSCEDGPSLYCTGSPLIISELGCAQDPASQGFGSIDFPGSPAAVELRVFHEEKLVTEQTYIPQYRRHQPNGERCEPVCFVASERLPLKLP